MIVAAIDRVTQPDIVEVPTIRMIPDVTWDSGRCDGRCHDENHHGERW